MGTNISLSSQIGGRTLIGAWALKGMNTEYRFSDILTSGGILFILLIFFILNHCFF